MISRQQIIAKTVKIINFASVISLTGSLAIIKNHLEKFSIQMFIVTYFTSFTIVSTKTRPKARLSC